MMTLDIQIVKIKTAQLLTLKTFSKPQNKLGYLRTI